MAATRKPGKHEETSVAPGPSQPPVVSTKDPATLAILQRAQKGDVSSMEAFEAFLDHPTAGPKLAEFFGDLAARTRDSAVEMVAGINLAVKAATPRTLAKMKDELEGPDPNPIERLLAERIVYCWLILWEYEHVLARRGGEMMFKEFEFHQRRIDAAHRRYLTALRTLATVRKLALPAVQINLGGNQVNVSAT